jgi:hypothetical protein
MARRNLLSSEEVTKIFMDLPNDGDVSDDPDFQGNDGDLDDSDVEDDEPIDDACIGTAVDIDPLSGGGGGSGDSDPLKMTLMTKILLSPNPIAPLGAKGQVELRRERRLLDYIPIPTWGAMDENIDVAYP